MPSRPSDAPHVVRDESWLPSSPPHRAVPCAGHRCRNVHTAQVLKIEETAKRKLSKRKDPEFGLEYFTGAVIHWVTIEYLMTLLNSNYEEGG